MYMAMENRFFLLLLAVVTVSFVMLLRPFWGAIFWAVAITIIFAPLNQWMVRRLGQRRIIASLCTLLCCVTVVLVPLVAVLYQVLDQAASLYQSVETGDMDPSRVYNSLSRAFPFIPQLMDALGVAPQDLNTALSDFVLVASRYLAEEAFSFGANTFRMLVNLALMLYLIFFMLRDGPWLVEQLKRALPLADQREHQLFRKFAEVTRATIKGNLIVAVVQGTLGGSMFAFLGLPAAVLWGVLMTFLSLFPAVGAFLVWGPAAIYLYASGEWVSAVILVAFGAVIVGLADNVLRPLLVGRDTKLPDYVVLTSTLSGLVLLGINGLVIGPLLAALFLTCWDIFTQDFDQEEVT